MALSRHRGMSGLTSASGGQADVAMLWSALDPTEYIACCPGVALAVAANHLHTRRSGENRGKLKC